MKVVRVAEATKKALGCDGVLLSQANGEAARQHVLHLHFHIYPRWNQIRIDMGGTSKNDKQAIFSKIKACL